jgi:hypothetical protein
MGGSKLIKVNRACSFHQAARRHVFGSNEDQSFQLVLGIKTNANQPHSDPGGPQVTRSAMPWPGKHYKIAEKKSGRLLTLERGTRSLILLPLETLKTRSTSFRYEWICVNRNGFFAFLEANTGLYIDYGPEMCLGGVLPKHLNEGGIVVREHPDGGCQMLLQTNTDEGLSLWGLESTLPPTSFLRLTPSTGNIAWEFVQV